MKQLRSKIQERHSLLEEKKHTPALKVLQHGKMARQIDALTKEIEKLKDKKVLLLKQFSCTDDQGMVKVKQRAASMESSLKKLNEGEVKYTSEMDTTLAQYARLQEQSGDMDTAEVEAARMMVRSDKESETLQQLKAAYGKRFDYARLAQCRKDIASILGEVSEPVSIRHEIQRLPEQQNRQSHGKKRSQER